MRVIFIRYLPPLIISLLTIAALGRKSMNPAIFQRYSYGYLLFLVLLVLLSGIVWNISIKTRSYRRFCTRLAQSPVIPLLIIGGSLLGMSLFFWQSTHELTLLLGLNKNLLGILVVVVAIFCCSTLASPRSVRDSIVNYALLTGTCCATLLCVEIGCRVNAASNLNLFENLQQTANMPKSGEDVPLGRMIRFHHNPRIIYELLPNLSVMFKDQPVSTDAKGLRTLPAISNHHKRPVRILGLGDSVMFGWGVKDDETYLAGLSGILNSVHPERSWEIINTAVPGYNTVMEVETLKEKGLAFKPDLVIIEYVGNDLDLPNFIREQENYLSLKKSFLKQLLFRLTQSSRVAEGLKHTPLQFASGHSEQDLQRIPKQYRDMVGEDAYRQAMRELRDLSEQHRFQVLVISWGFPQFVREVCSQLQFDTLEIYPVWKAFAEKQRFVDELAAWQLTPTDPHPSVTGHQVIAETIAAYLEEHGYIQELLRKPSS